MAGELKMKKKKITCKNIFISLGISIGGACAFLLIGGLSAFLPNPNIPSIEMIIVVLMIDLCFAFCGFFSYLWKFHWAKMCVGICASGMFLMPAIRGISVLIPNWWVWSLPLFLAFIIAWMLPVINSRIARRIHEEQFAPSTRLGKGCITLFLGLAGAGGAAGALFGSFSLRLTGSANLAMVFISFAFSILSVALAQTFAYQLWDQRQWEKTKIQADTNTRG
jgi:FlaA1/EpsC-like NDP-sugar epimerase